MDSTDEFRTVSTCLIGRLSESYRCLPSHQKLPSESHLKKHQEKELKAATEAMRAAMLHLNRFIEGD